MRLHLAAPFDFRIGVNSGEMVAAAYGGDRLANFSVRGLRWNSPGASARRVATYGLPDFAWARHF